LPQPVRIDDDLREFLESGVSVIVGTRDARFLGEVLRAVGTRVVADGAEVVVYVPEATGARTLANLADNGRVSLCCARIADHVTIQVKGRALAVEAASDEDRARIDRYRRALAENLAFIGLPLRLGLRLAHWPARAVRFAVDEVFLATPGPGAGAPLAAKEPPGDAGAPMESVA